MGKTINLHPPISYNKVCARCMHYEPGLERCKLYNSVPKGPSDFDCNSFTHFRTIASLKEISKARIAVPKGV